MTYGKGSSLIVVVTDDTELKWKGKGCTSPATVANLVSGAGVAELKLGRRSADDHDVAPDDSGHHGDTTDDGGPARAQRDSVG